MLFSTILPFGFGMCVYTYIRLYGACFLNSYKGKLTFTFYILLFARCIFSPLCARFLIFHWLFFLLFVRALVAFRILNSFSQHLPHSVRASSSSSSSSIGFYAKYKIAAKHPHINTYIHTSNFFFSKF